MVAILVRGSRCATSWCDFDLTLSEGPRVLKSCLGYFLDSIRCRRLTLGKEHWLGSVGVHHGATKVCSPAIFRTSFSYDKGIWIAATDYHMHFYPTALKGCRSIVFTHGIQAGGWREKDCPGCISETIRCRKLLLGRDIG